MAGQIKAALEEELGHVPLKITGCIPQWLSGTLIRNGPVFVSKGEQTIPHWFDGLAMLHAFEFQQGKLFYTNKFLRTEAYKQAFENGELSWSGFAMDPCRGLFKQLFTHFFHRDQKVPNANINVAKLAEKYVAFTETPLPVEFDLRTLKTLGLFNYADKLPHARCWESAHPHQCPVSHDTLNYLIEYGRESFYTLYRLKEQNSTREVVGKIATEMPAYMHSFAITENYAVFTEYPLVVRPLEMITKNRPFIEHFQWQPERGTCFNVVDRHSGNLVGSYKAKPFFAFHHVNAFEEKESLHLDIVTYPDPAVISQVAHYFQEKWAATTEEVASRLERFTLSIPEAKITSLTLLDLPVEFPRINGSLDGLQYRIVYLIDAREPSSHQDERPIYRFDTASKSVKKWSSPGCYPGEAVFVGKPEGTGEDSGVVMSVVLDLNRHLSFLLVLDAATFEELARAEVAHAIPPGLHGQYFGY